MDVAMYFIQQALSLWTETQQSIFFLLYNQEAWGLQDSNSDSITGWVGSAVIICNSYQNGFSESHWF